MTNSRPRVVCLCGSTRFYKEFQRANYEETMAGKIVLSVGFYMHASKDAHGEKWECTPEQKIALDALHFRKIELADEILVINVGDYVGESTRNEINHAKSLGKPIRWLQPHFTQSLCTCGDQWTVKQSAKRIACGEIVLTFFMVTRLRTDMRLKIRHR